MGFPDGSDGKESICNAGHVGVIPGSGRSPEKGMATHSCVLGWRIPWTEEPDGLQSMGLQRVGHDWSTNRVPIELIKIFICSHLSLFPLMIMVFVLSLEIFPTLRL